MLPGGVSRFLYICFKGLLYVLNQRYRIVVPENVYFQRDFNFIFVMSYSSR